MSEKKNIVIKVRYPSPGKITEHHATAPGVVTEWNVKRVALALGSILFAMMMWFYFAGSDDKPEVIAEQTALPLQPQQPITTQGQAETFTGNPSDIKEQAQSKVAIDNSKAVVRSQLTSDIDKNEPVDNLKLPLKIGKKDTLWIYYFVELKNMKGQAIYHEWWLNGNLVSRKKVNVSDDPWRTASKQLITYTTNNDWIVRIVDESRNTLAEKSFNLDLK